MALQDFITENEAAAYSGVSIQTLNRFAEAGYLQIELDGKAMRLFSSSELAEVFGLPPAPRKSPAAFEAAPAPRASAAPAKSTSTGQPRSEPPVATPANANDLPQQVAFEQPAPAATRLSDAIEIEVTKLRSVVALQEKLLDLREAQLKDLKDEREWLRSRIEKLDEKSDRDQLLLLSETQTIRKLVTNAQTKHSAFRTALEWLGVLEPQGTLSGTPLIELSRDERGQHTV